MTRAQPITALREFTVTTYEQDSFVFTEADFLDEPEIRNIDGRIYGTGHTALGLRTIRLNVPLCASCDKPISDNICVRCEYQFQRRAA